MTFTSVLLRALCVSNVSVLTENARFEEEPFDRYAEPRSADARFSVLRMGVHGDARATSRGARSERGALRWLHEIRAALAALGPGSLRHYARCRRRRWRGVARASSAGFKQSGRLMRHSDRLLPLSLLLMAWAAHPQGPPSRS